MTKKAVPGIDDARGWDERLGWAYDLIAPDPSERTVALARLTRARAAAKAAIDRCNETWRMAGQFGCNAGERAAAQEAFEEAASRSLPEALWVRYHHADISTWPGLPFAVLYLEWEARYPQEWTQRAKTWGVKESLIRKLATADHDAGTRAKLVDLVDLVVQRAYRCKDREYVRVARAVDGPDLRERLAEALASENPWAQLHAGYVLRLLDNPDLPNTRRTWNTWLADTGTTHG